MCFNLLIYIEVLKGKEFMSVSEMLSHDQGFKSWCMSRK